MAVLKSWSVAQEACLVHRVKRWRSALLSLVVLIGLLGSQSRANAQGSREYQLKAVLLLNLVRFVEWPAEAFTSPEAPLVIGVMGQDPFGSVLDEVVRDETVQNRRVEIRRCASVNDARKCHLLFIAASERRRFEIINTQLSRTPILTVADAEGFIGAGGMVHLILKPDGKIGLRINDNEAKAAKLSISAKLLRVAQVVRREND